MNNKSHAPDSISTQNFRFGDFMVRLNKCRTLMGGTEAMRLAEEIYLPQFEGENEKNYKFRLSLSFLFNGYRETIRYMTGRVFQKRTRLSENTNPVFFEWAKNIDLLGTDLSDFAKQTLFSGTQSGIEYLLVDAPPAQTGQTRADAMSKNIRPYIVHITPENVIDFHETRIQNMNVLTHFRFKEFIDQPKDEFSIDKIEQIRVFDLIDSNVWSRVFQKSKSSGHWEQFGDSVVTGLSEITIEPFYAEKSGYFRGTPPFEDLADLNIAHWQSQSDQRNILHSARVPILFGKGLPETAEIKISASSITKSTSPDADIKFVEHSGAAIGAGQADLQHLEDQMRVMGLKVMQEAVPMTATGEMRGEMRELSRLGSIAESLEMALQKCFIWMGEYGGVEFDGQVEVHKDFGFGTVNAVALNALISSVKMGKIPTRQFWHELLRMGILSEGFDPDVAEAQLDIEMSDMDGLLHQNTESNEPE